MGPLDSTGQRSAAIHMMGCPSSHSITSAGTTATKADSGLSGCKQSEPSGDMTKKILIVDDDPNIVISLEFLMKREGFDVVVARDGEAALQAMAERVPDLVLLDIVMPKKDGYEVCQQIRATPAWKDVRIVMVTAKGRDTERAKGLALGADAYVTKPFSTKDLAQLVRQLLGVAS